MPVRNNRPTSTAAMPPSPQLRVNLRVSRGTVSGWRWRIRSVMDLLDFGISNKTFHGLKTPSSLI
jgi:hypothetical protein